VTLDVPVSVDIARSILLDTGSLNLLETPLWQIDVTSAEITTQILVLQTERRSKRANFGVVPRGGISNDFNNPMIFSVTDGSIAVAGDFPVGFRDGSIDLMRV
jgi:hypothetical protein